MRRHTRPRPRASFVARFDDSSFPLWDRLADYAENLLACDHKLTNDFLAFFTMLLTKESLKKLLKAIQPRETKRNKARKSSRRFNAQARELGWADYLGRRHYAEMILEGGFDMPAEQLKALLHKLVRRDRKQRKPEGRKWGKQLSELQALFGFSDDDLKILCFLYCYNESEDLAGLTRHLPPNSMFKFVSSATGVRVSHVREALGISGRIMESGLMYPPHEFGDPYALALPIQEYLAGRGDASLVETYCRLDRGPAYKLRSFHVPDLSKEIITALLQKDGGTGILLYGKAGTGKTEFARSVIRKAGGQPIILNYGEDGSNAERLLALKVAVRTAAAQPGSVLIADEADLILNLAQNRHEGLSKSWLNDFLDTMAVKIVWVTNRTMEAEESTLRRFAYSLHFKGFSFHERVGIWKNLKKGHPLAKFITKELITELGAKYQVETGGIRSALDTLAEIVPKAEAGPDRVKAVLSDLLARHAEVTGNEARDSRISPLSPRYDVSALNTDCDPDDLVRGLKALTGGRQMADLMEGENICLLFHGLSGTGKTEFAKFLASELKLNLLVKRASDLESMWVGQTEKNIRSAFEEAVRDNAVLFVDEADTFFTERATAGRAYEVSRTNEFLTQMENHKGVLVCCTNLLGNLDNASLRRFHWKVEFRPLTGEGKITLYRKYFPGSLSPARKDRLGRISGLTPGDFKAVWQRHRFAGPDSLRPDQVITELEQEAGFKSGLISRKMGF